MAPTAAVANAANATMQVARTATTAAGRRTLAVLQSRQDARRRLDVLMSPGKRAVSLQGSRATARMRLLNVLGLTAAGRSMAPAAVAGQRSLSTIVPNPSSFTGELYPTIKERRRSKRLSLSPSTPRTAAATSEARIADVLQHLRRHSSPSKRTPMSQYPVIQPRTAEQRMLAAQPVVSEYPVIQPRTHSPQAMQQ